MESVGSQYVDSYNSGVKKRLPFWDARKGIKTSSKHKIDDKSEIQCIERLGGLLKSIFQVISSMLEIT